MNWMLSPSGMWVGNEEGVIGIYTIDQPNDIPPDKYRLCMTGEIGIAIPIGGPYDDVASAKTAAETDALG